MTREEAITILKDISWQMGSVKRWENIEAIDMAIEALQTEPVCEHFYKGYCNRFEDGCFHQCQAEPKTGEWVESEIPNELYVCSNCGGACWSYDYERTIVKSNFCPNCGARMGVNNE